VVVGRNTDRNQYGKFKIQNSKFKIMEIKEIKEIRASFP
jgi:hypothetical protein